MLRTPQVKEPNNTVEEEEEIMTHAAAFTNLWNISACENLVGEMSRLRLPGHGKDQKSSSAGRGLKKRCPFRANVRAGEGPNLSDGRAGTHQGADEKTSRRERMADAADVGKGHQVNRLQKTCNPTEDERIMRGRKPKVAEPSKHKAGDNHQEASISEKAALPEIRLRMNKGWKVRAFVWEQLELALELSKPTVALEPIAAVAPSESRTPPRLQAQQDTMMPSWTGAQAGSKPPSSIVRLGHIIADRKVGGKAVDVEVATILVDFARRRIKVVRSFRTGTLSTFIIVVKMSVEEKNHKWKDAIQSHFDRENAHHKSRVQACFADLAREENLMSPRENKLDVMLGRRENLVKQSFHNPCLEANGSARQTARLKSEEIRVWDFVEIPQAERGGALGEATSGPTTSGEETRRKGEEA